ncbi:hypothetical protein AAE478_009898 [Parahypoxylon ruwenzoriense]
MNPFGAPSSNTNRFSALNTGGARSQDVPNPYKITKDSIKVDLADERPSWILSCYGPGRDAPEQLFGGYPREQSLEEVMMHIKGSNNQQQALSEVTALYQQAEQQIQATLNNLDGAMQFLLAAENNHPNRIDICKQNTREGGTIGVFARETVGPQIGFLNPLTSNSNVTQNPFSSAPQPSPFSGGGGGPSFGQPSALGQRPNPFGSTSSSATFGQPSTMGAGGSAFGQPSALGQKPNPFTAASSGSTGFSQTAAQPSAFGQTSALGQRPNPFGAPAPSASSPFAQGATSTTSTVSAFGQPVAPNPFAQAASTTDVSADQPMDTLTPTLAPHNPFGQPSSGSPFSSPPSNVFVAQQQQPCGFGAVMSNPFAQAQAQSQSLLQPQVQAQTAPVAKNSNNPYGPNSAKHHPPAESYITKAMNGRITSFDGQPVIYKWKVSDKYQDAAPQDYTTREPPAPGVRNADGSWRKIFFPDGPPGYNKDTEPDPSMYNANVKAAYGIMVATGRFEGDMPEVPPMREDCVWNF